MILIQDLIHEIRGKKVMLDFDLARFFDLARLYQVETKALKQAVRRNLDRFPDDFMFTLSQEEYNALKLNIRSQFVTLNESSIGKYPKYPPFAFTEQGVAMLSSVLRSETAIQANIAIMRAFVQVREYLLTASSVSSELKELRAKVDLLASREDEDRGNIDTLSWKSGRKSQGPVLVSNKTYYSFFSSVAGLVRAARRVCQRTESREITSVIRTATTKIHQ